jgi:dTDP-4-dehydrorhamnose reductase
MRILLLGAGGQLARELVRELAGETLTPVAHAQLDIRDHSGVEALIEQTRPECIINTAAFHRVDDCEDHPELARAVNVEAVRHLAHAAERAGALLVQLSTNYVFDGRTTQPYAEDAAPNPVSVYGRSRLEGERAAREESSRVLIVRTCGLYAAGGSRSKHGGNFVEMMLHLAAERKAIRVVNDQRCTPTRARDLAAWLADLVRAQTTGLFHVTNSGACSWYEFAQEIFRLSGVKPDLRAVSSAEFGARAPRPAYSVLENRALRTAGYAPLPPWPEALACYLRKERQSASQTRHA